MATKKRAPKASDNTRAKPVRKRKAKSKAMVKGVGGPDPERTEQLCKLLRMGAYLETAAPAVGITSRTLRAWLQRGAAAADPPTPADAPYLHFRRSIEEAHAQAEHHMLAAIARAANGESPKPVLNPDGTAVMDANGKVVMTPGHKPDWRAAAFLMERKFQARWAEVRKIDVRVQQGMETLLDRVRGHMPTSSYRDLIKALEAVREEELRGDTITV